QADQRVLLPERGNRRRQHEARLRMGREEYQLAMHVATQVGGQRTDGAGLFQDDAGAGDDLMPGGRDRAQALALACKQLESEFAFELLELLADARLRGVDALGGEGDVEAGIGNRNDITQLCQGHDVRSPGGCWASWLNRAKRSCQ